MIGRGQRHVMKEESSVIQHVDRRSMSSANLCLGGKKDTDCENKEIIVRQLHVMKTAGVRNTRTKKMKVNRTPNIWPIDWILMTYSLLDAQMTRPLLPIEVKRRLDWWKCPSIQRPFSISKWRWWMYFGLWGTFLMTCTCTVAYAIAESAKKLSKRKPSAWKSGVIARTDGQIEIRASALALLSSTGEQKESIVDTAQQQQQTRDINWGKNKLIRLVSLIHPFEKSFPTTTLSKHIKSGLVSLSVSTHIPVDSLPIRIGKTFLFYEQYNVD